MNQAAKTEADKIRKFGLYAHAFCLAVTAAAALFAAWLAWTILFAPGPAGVRVNFGQYFVTADKITTAGIKIYALLVVVLVFGLMLAAGWVDAASVTRSEYAVGPDSFSLFITGGLILLASWIMEVGRQTTDEAEELRREAELVV